MIFISPILTYFYGKRWYCSWVCGGVWQKHGDSYIYPDKNSMDDPPVLVFSFVMTIAVIFSFLSNNPEMSFVTKDHFIWELLFS
jgi:hypothetical protein